MKHQRTNSLIHSAPVGDRHSQMLAQFKANQPERLAKRAIQLIKTDHREMDIFDAEILRARLMHMNAGILKMEQYGDALQEKLEMKIHQVGIHLDELKDTINLKASTSSSNDVSEESDHGLMFR